MQHSLVHPYRGTGPLSAETTPVQIGQGKAAVYINGETANYIEALQRLVRDAGFVFDTPMIDLTGHYPGALFALGAKPAGAAWLIGGYPGSTVLAMRMLDQLSCSEVARSWIVVERNGPRRFPDTLLLRYGIDPQTDYESVGTADAPRGSFPTRFKHEILKPKRSIVDATLACERTAKPNP